ncbi:ATP-binding protein [Actinoallomurus sp. NPDC052274]|uniref:ATP-binding protein n=1 Tax=Actinoallomurus sp. NPDC052274 TaxID=3155420 RepID=UPI00341B8D26
MSGIAINPGVARYVDLGPGPEFAGVARRFGRRVLSAWGLGRLADDVEQITGELVANAIPGGEYRLTLYLDLRTAVLRVEVADQRKGKPEQRRPCDDDEHGRGLWIVETLADSWGYEETARGNRVWAELHVRRGLK